MKILIATGIFPPEIGGPAAYAQRLAEHFNKAGHPTLVISYGTLVQREENKGRNVTIILRNRGPIIRKMSYFFSLLGAALKSDIILGLDDFSAAFPAALVQIITGKKLILRLGGDFLWEKSVEDEATTAPLREFYSLPLRGKQKFLKRLIDFSLRRATRIIFSTNFQKDIYMRHHGVLEEKTAVISNPAERIEFPPTPQKIKNQIIFAGRLVKLKNLEFLLGVFSEVIKSKPGLTLNIVGEGPEEKRIKEKIEEEKLGSAVKLSGRLGRRELLEAIAESLFFVLPSLSDISPNVIFDCVMLGKPFILTSETGLTEIFRDNVLYANPKDPKDFKEKMLSLFDSRTYAEYERRLRRVTYEKSWEEYSKEVFQVLQSK